MTPVTVRQFATEHRGPAVLGCTQTMRVRDCLPLCAAVLGCGAPSEVEPDTAATNDGHFAVQLEISPRSPTVGDHRVDVTLLARDDAPVTGAVVQIEPWMAAHGHGSPVSASVVEGELGTYHAEPVRFTMPGRWELRFTFDADGVQDQLTWRVDVR